MATKLTNLDTARDWMRQTAWASCEAARADGAGEPELAADMLADAQAFAGYAAEAADAVEGEDERGFAAEYARRARGFAAGAALIVG